METNIFEDIAKLITTLYFKKEFNYFQDLLISSTHLEKTYFYQFNIIQHQASDSIFILKFFYNLDFFVTEGLKNFIIYLNRLTKLGLFSLQGQIVTYENTIKILKNSKKQSKIAIFYETLREMNLNFSKILPTFRSFSDDSDEKAFESSFKTFKIMKKMKSADFNCKVRYTDISNKKINKINEILWEDLKIILKILNDKQLIDFFLPYAEINFSKSSINYSKHCKKNSKVLPSSSKNSKIIETLSKIENLLEKIGYSPNFDLIIEDLFEDPSKEYYILGKCQLSCYIKLSSPKKSEKSLQSSLESFIKLENFELFTRSSYFFNNIDLYLTSVPSVNYFEISAKSFKRYSEFKSLNSKNLLSFQGLFKGRDKKFYILTETFEIGSFYKKFRGCSSDIFLDLRKSVLELVSLIFLCGQKGLAGLDLSSEYLDYSSNKVKLVPSFKEIRKDFKAPEEKTVLTNEQRVQSDFYRLGLMIVDLLVKDDCIAYVKETGGNEENIDFFQMIDPLNEQFSELQEKLGSKYQELLTIAQSLVLQGPSERPDAEALNSLLSN